MLLLVLADRHMGRAIDENVGSHQRGIGIEANGRVLAVLAGLLLELRHPVEPADAGNAIEDPGQFGMFRHLALVEHDMSRRIDTSRNEGSGYFTDVGLQELRVLRHRDGMQIDDTVDALVRLLQRHELRDRAEVISEMKVSGRLNAGKHELFESGHGSPHVPPIGPGL